MQAFVEPRRGNGVNPVVLFVHVLSQFLNFLRKFTESRVIVALQSKVLQILQLMFEVVLLLL